MRRGLTFTVVTLSMLSPACKFQSGSLVRGYVSEGDGYRWPKATAAVCWETSDDGLRLTQTSIKDLVTREYARAKFIFTGWDVCTDTSKGLRVKNFDGQGFGHTLAFGYKLDGMFSGIQLALDTPENLARKQITPVAAINALHEFGHAIGLRHESNRPDSPCSQDQTQGHGEAGGLMVGDYDPDSIMNYCGMTANLYDRAVASLSTGDVQTITWYYAASEAQFKDITACQGDGNVWQAWDSSACCAVQPAGRVVASAHRSYSYCNEVSTGPQDAPGPAANVATTNATFLLPPLSFQPQLALLRCDKGTFWSQSFAAGSSAASGQSPQQATVPMPVIAAKKGSITFHCTSLDIYDGQRGSFSAKLSRITFPAAVDILMDGGSSWNLDLSRVSALDINMNQ